MRVNSYNICSVVLVFLSQTIYLYVYWFCFVYPAFCFWSQLCCSAVCLCAAGVLQVSGIRIYTSGDVEAVNGTDVRLKCTFQSSSPINPNAIIVSWTFRPLMKGGEESVGVCMCLCVLVSNWDQTSLTVSGSIHPLSRLREESVSHQAPYGATKTTCVCLCAHNYVWKRCSSRSGLMSFSLCESKIPSLTSSSSFSLLCLLICDSPTNEIKSTKSTHVILLVGVPLPAATVSPYRGQFQEACRLGWWHHGPWRLHHTSTGQIHLQWHLHLPGQESAGCPRHGRRDSPSCRHHRLGVWFLDKIFLPIFHLHSLVLSVSTEAFTFHLMLKC